jgi:H+/gluconate symporter-like permease
VPLLAPIAAMVTALLSGEPLLAHWTQTFMGSAAGFLGQFFPLFLLGALFGKPMVDSGSVAVIARFTTGKLGAQRTMLAVVLAGAFVNAAASACSLPFLFSPRWRNNCSVPPVFQGA